MSLTGGRDETVLKIKAFGEGKTVLLKNVVFLGGKTAQNVFVMLGFLTIRSCSFHKTRDNRI